VVGDETSAQFPTALADPGSVQAPNQSEPARQLWLGWDLAGLKNGGLRRRDVFTPGLIVRVGQARH